MARIPLFRRTALSLLTVGMCTACASDTSPTATTAGPGVSPRLARVGVAATARPAELAALDEAVRAVALALQDADLRASVHADMRASRFTGEHKLPLATYLRGAGSALLAHAAERTGASPASLLSRMAAAGDLEFYMPVPEHRATWTGDDNLIVAGLLMEGDAPLAYTLQGELMFLDRRTPPQTPMLVIVRSETDFQRQAPADWTNVDDANGSAIGTLVSPTAKLRRAERRASSSLSGTQMAVTTSSDDPTCDPETAIEPCGGEPGTGSPADYPPGLYLQSNTLFDDGEDYTLGAPEIVLLVVGPTVYATSDGEKIMCAGQFASGAYWFNQNEATFTADPYYVEGMIMSGGLLDSVDNTYRDRYSLQMFESDKAPDCDMDVNTRTTLENAVAAVRSAWSIWTLGVEIIGAGDWDIVTGNANAIRGIITSDFVFDDWLGTMVDQNVIFGYTKYSGSTHVLIKGRNSNGTPIENGYSHVRTEVQ